MIPIRDDAPRSITPSVTYFLVALNSLIFLFEATLPDQALNGFVSQFGFVPGRVNAAFSGVANASLESALFPMFTSMFLHGSWLHLISNMWVLLIFGDNLEDYLGHFRYLVFYLGAGIAASVVHFLFNQGSPVPSVGASGAIAGVMGAYFFLFPSARVLTIVPFIFLSVWLPAWIVLGYWFLAQFINGFESTITRAGLRGGGIAFWAHVGGFIAGASIIKLLPKRPPRYSFER